MVAGGASDHPPNRQATDEYSSPSGTRLTTDSVVASRGDSPASYGTACRWRLLQSNSSAVYLPWAELPNSSHREGEGECTCSSLFCPTAPLRQLQVQQAALQHSSWVTAVLSSFDLTRTPSRRQENRVPQKARNHRAEPLRCHMHNLGGMHARCVLMDKTIQLTGSRHGRD